MLDIALIAALAGIVGACLGSALANIAWCWPDRLRGLARRRSACESCGRPLGFMDLLPVLGWFIRRGHCAHCDAEIPAYYWQVELVAGIVAAASVAKLGLGHGLIAAAVGLVLLLAARIDMDRMILPDVLTLPLLAMGVAASFLPGWPGPGPQSALVGAIAGYALLAGVRWCYFHFKGIEGLGLGDAKLFAAAGAWTGLQALPAMLVLAAGATLLLALARGHGLRSQAALPFGPALAGAFWLQLVWTWPLR